MSTTTFEQATVFSWPSHQGACPPTCQRRPGRPVLPALSSLAWLTPLAPRLCNSLCPCCATGTALVPIRALGSTHHANSCTEMPNRGNSCLATKPARLHEITRTGSRLLNCVPTKSGQALVHPSGRAKRQPTTLASLCPCPVPRTCWLKKFSDIGRETFWLSGWWQKNRCALHVWSSSGKRFTTRRLSRTSAMLRWYLREQRYVNRTVVAGGLTLPDS